MKGTAEMMGGPSAGTESGRPVKQPLAAVVKSYGSKRKGKKAEKKKKISHVWYTKMNASEPLKKCR